MSRRGRTSWRQPKLGECNRQFYFASRSHVFFREIAEADDAKREAEAKKITEGHYRVKRRGKDFYSDGEGSGDEGRGGHKRKWSKRERQKRRLDREDGLEKLGKQ